MHSLTDQLASLRAEKEATRDPGLTAVMNRATADLRASGILDRVKAAGDRAPRFARPNLEGKVVRLGPLLQAGPVIVSFFRGRW